MKTKNKCFSLASDISHYQPGGLWVNIATAVVWHSSFQYDSKLYAFWKTNTADVMLQINAWQDTKCSRRKQFSCTNLKLVLLHSFPLHQHHVNRNSKNFSCVKDKTQNLNHTASTHTHIQICTRTLKCFQSFFKKHKQNIIHTLGSQHRVTSTKL